MPLRPIALAIAVLAAACCAAPASAAVHLTTVGSFTAPVYVTAPPADPHRLFVVEQAGRVMEVLDGQKLDTPFLDISRDVRSGGEQGLLSMAFAPDYATSGRFYVYFTAPRAGDSSGSVITVQEFKRAAGNPDAADPASRRTIFTVDHPAQTNHNGGQLQFGPDGLLYAGTGDGGGGNDQGGGRPSNNAQNLNSKLGKLLRVDPLSPGAADPQIYAYGLRNPFRFSFDRQTGDLVIGDVGQSAREEVDFSPAGTPAGTNYGWVCREGSIQNPNASPTCTAPNAVDPVLEKNHSGDGFCAIIGGYVVRDPALGALAGRYVYGDNCATAVRSAALASPRVTDDSATGLTVPGLTSFGEDSCGHLYATAGGGSLYRFDGDSFTACPDPAVPGTPGTPPPPPPVDKRAPVVRMSVQRRQRVLSAGGLRLAMSCDEVCAAKATGKVRIHGSKSVYVLKAVSKRLAANQRLKVKLAGSKRALRAFRSALRHHHRVSATLQVTGSDAAGNSATTKRNAVARR
jgi:Glucose / Sorbosone dehydrogenase